MFSNCMQDLYTAWRIAVRKVWRVPWTTHCKLLPHLASCIDIELWMSKRCINFLLMAINSKSNVVRMISNMGVNGTHSIMGANFRLMQTRYEMNVSNVYVKWKDMCNSDQESIRICQLMRDVIGEIDVNGLSSAGLSVKI